jgi:hypothetical protein
LLGQFTDPWPVQISKVENLLGFNVFLVKLIIDLGDLLVN